MSWKHWMYTPDYSERLYRKHCALLPCWPSADAALMRRRAIVAAEQERDARTLERFEFVLGERGLVVRERVREVAAA